MYVTEGDKCDVYMPCIRISAASDVCYIKVLECYGLHG